MNLEALKEMIKVYLNDLEGHNINTKKKADVLNDFLLYWQDQWRDENDEDEIAF